ncbi:MAG: epoxyqueuosine reductase QueH [Syntrophales bacterium]
MKILLHICCAPCTIYPLKILRQEGYDVSGLFYNPNIHPYLEYKRRLDTLKEYACKEELNVTCTEEYHLEDFLRNVVFREKDRCRYCYYTRLRYAADIARAERFDVFTTTLLYSKYQDHEMIKTIGESLAKEYGLKFYYHDFREGWAEGIKISRELMMYRQPYCGCIYSEKERFYRSPEAK